MPRQDAFDPLAKILAQSLDYESKAEPGTKESSIKKVLRGLFTDRYWERSEPRDSFRDAYSQKDDGVPYAGIIAPENPTSGPYGGASVAWFPCASGTLMTLVVGTRGLAPDEGLLTRHGHRRRVEALRNYLSQRGVIAWSKSDPAGISTPIPESARRRFPACDTVFKRYGDVIYSAAWIPKGDEAAAALASRAYIDLYARERGWDIRSDQKPEYEAYLTTLQEHVFPTVTPADVNGLLRQRRFVILQGPPGTGKTRLAEFVRREFFHGRGGTVQFHPAVTYEDFVVGLSPVPAAAGLTFNVKPGWLLDAAEAAADQPYLLVIDEINRGDLAKVLGEAIYLFEPGEVGGTSAREVRLTHAVNGRNTFRMPENLYVLGTMNTADRSISSLDLAVRRRFAFVTVMPDLGVVTLDTARKVFTELASVFVEHAPDEMLHLLPGQSYFLAADERVLADRLRYELLPLLDEYLRQGLLGPATSDLHAVRELIADTAAQRAIVA